jgi:hypothetical protein
MKNELGSGFWKRCHGFRERIASLTKRKKSSGRDSPASQSLGERRDDFHSVGRK